MSESHSSLQMNELHKVHISISSKRHAKSIKLRLVAILFFFVISNAIQSQVFPKVSLDYFNGDDSKTADFLGWIQGCASILQFLILPSLAASCDVKGRQSLLIFTVITQAVAMFIWSFTPGNLLIASASSIISSLCWVIIPISQAIIGDLTRHDGESAAHDFGIISGTFGLGLCIGPLLGGWLTSLHKSIACFTSAGAGFMAVFVATAFRWEDTYRPITSDVNSNADIVRSSTTSTVAVSTSICKISNPFSFFSMVPEKKQLQRLAMIYACTSFALAVCSSWYTLLDFRFGWGPVRIGGFAAYIGLSIAVVQSIVIRALVPRVFNQITAALFGLGFLAFSLCLFAFAYRGWHMYAIAPFIALSSVAEPCLQAMMASSTPANQQGSLQGTVFSIRIIAQGISAPLYGLLFQFGISNTFENVVHIQLPGISFLFASVSAILGAILALNLITVKSKSSLRISRSSSKFPEAGFEPLLGEGEVFSSQFEDSRLLVKMQNERVDVEFGINMDQSVNFDLYMEKGAERFDTEDIFCGSLISADALCRIK